MSCIRVLYPALPFTLLFGRRGCYSCAMKLSHIFLFLALLCTLSCRRHDIRVARITVPQMVDQAAADRITMIVKRIPGVRGDEIVLDRERRVRIKIWWMWNNWVVQKRVRAGPQILKEHIKNKFKETDATTLSISSEEEGCIPPPARAPASRRGRGRAPRRQGWLG